MDEAMNKHLTVERVSALLDEPSADRVGQEHLEACDDCQTEYERLSRMRMTLSALGDEDPPAGQWAAIEAALLETDIGSGAIEAVPSETEIGQSATPLPFHRRVGRRFLVPGPLQAAAALVLFAGGVFAGLQVMGTGSPPSGEAERSDLPAVIASSSDRAMFDGLTQLESLRTPLRQIGLGGDAQDAPGPDPYAATRRLARLEGFIRALRDQLEQSPGDPVASAYLVELVEQRDRLEEELQASVRRDGVVTW